MTLDGELLAPRDTRRLPAAAEIGELLAALDRPHSFRRHRWRRVALATIVIAVLVVRWQASGIGVSAANLSEGRYQVTGIHDERTLELTGGVEVRLLGLEPIVRRSAASDESVDAIEFARRLVAGGRVPCSLIARGSTTKGIAWPTSGSTIRRQNGC